jgi:hypothetical protein
LDEEYSNIRAALNWAQESGAIAEGLRLATDLESFWYWRVHLQEPSLALENLLARPLPADQIQAFARGHSVAGRLQFLVGNKIPSESHFKESERWCLLLGPEGKVDLAEARHLLDFLTYGTIAKEPIQVRQRYDEVLQLLQETGDQWKTANMIYDIGLELVRLGDFIGARQVLEQTLKLVQECGDTIVASRAMTMEQAIAYALEEPPN